MPPTTPIREIHEFELTSICNLACVYCPHPTMTREKAHASFEVVEQTLRHVKHYCDQGTQGEVSLTGIGEAILHPQFDDIVSAFRMVIGPRKLVLSTNGVGIEDHHIESLLRNQVLVFVSLHRPEVAAPAALRMRQAGIRVEENHKFVDSALNWAGQVKWHVSAQRKRCDYLGLGWGVVRQDGSVNACCMDAGSLDPIGHVRDEPGTLRTRTISLCQACHLVPPYELRESA
jgi:hypothetical protein